MIKEECKGAKQASQHMDEVMISRLSAEHKETVARAGDSGCMYDSEEADSWHMDEMISRLSAEHEEVVARSGDSGRMQDSQKADPWHLDEGMISRLSAEHEETVARAGDSGRLYDSQEADPWSSWSLRQNSARDSRQNSARDSRQNSAKDSRQNSARDSCQNSARDHVIEIQQDALKRESKRVHEKALALSPLSDTPLISELTSMGQRDSQMISPPRPPKTFQHKIGSSLEYFSILAHLAFFGIIGVLIRYGLEVLFHDVLSVTHEGTILYRDLPANVVGSFFMGWVGVVLKKDILLLSEPLAIGLSTGLMGSITTYAAWNQKMVALLTIGNVEAALSGLLLGMAIAQMSLVAGIDSARGLKLATAKLLWDNNKRDLDNVGKQPRVNSRGCTLSLVVIILATACLWGAALALLIGGHSSQNLNILWLACLVAPPGVWARWHLARFNGKGVRGRLKWLPVGTLLANLIGASLEAVLALLEFVVTNHNAPLVIGGLQLGFMGCLSTVSTFVAEAYTMHVGAMRAKAYTYTILTLGLGLVLSTLLYTAPTLAQGYEKW